MGEIVCKENEAILKWTSQLEAGTLHPAEAVDVPLALIKECYHWIQGIHYYTQQNESLPAVILEQPHQLVPSG